MKNTAPHNVARSTLENKTIEDTIAISEIFGPTIQGEGALIGTPTLFVRTGGCDYRCQWCDTGYAVLPKYENDWLAMDVKSIMKKITQLSQSKPLWVTLSGGNPAIQNLEGLIKLGHKQGYQFSMETQASIAKPWFSLLDQITFSPKPPSSGMIFKARNLERCLAVCDDLSKVSLKFVIADNADLIWAKDIADQYPNIDCFLQACNLTAAIDINISDSQANSSHQDQQQSLLALIDSAQSLQWHNVRILPQLHTWLWGNQTGV